MSIVACGGLLPLSSSLLFLFCAGWMVSKMRSGGHHASEQKERREERRGPLLASGGQYIFLLLLCFFFLGRTHAASVRVVVGGKRNRAVYNMSVAFKGT